MSIKNFLSRDVKLSLVQAALADGSTDPDSTALDMSGFDGVMFVGICGTITGSGTINLAASQSDDNAASDDFSAIPTASATATASTKSDKLLVLDIFQPAKRYVRTTVTRAVANSVYGGTLAIQYKAKDRPTTTAAATLAASIVQVTTPAE
jgi:hypothetical protein